MSDDDFHRFLKRWSKNVFNRDDTPEYLNLDRSDEYGDWSKRFLSHYDKAESTRGTGKGGTIDLIKKVTSDVLSYIDEVEEEAKKSKKKR